MTTREKWNWKPAQVARAIAIAKRAGLNVTGYTITSTGDIKIETGKIMSEAVDTSQSPNPWDTHHAADQERPA
jgi:hypothetical protein